MSRKTPIRDKIPTQVLLDPALHKRLQTAAAEQHRTIAATLRHLIELYLDGRLYTLEAEQGGMFPLGVTQADGYGSHARPTPTIEGAVSHARQGT